MTEVNSAAPLLARGQVDSDERRLQALGYAQELSWGGPVGQGLQLE